MIEEPDEWRDESWRHYFHHHKQHDYDQRIEGVAWSWNGRVVAVREGKNDRRFFVASTQTLTSAGEVATAKVSWLDQNGAAFTPAGPTTVTSSDSAGAVATSAPSADGLSAQFTAVADGTLTVTFSANNNEGAAVTAEGTLTVAIPAPVADLTSGTVDWTQP